MNVISNLGQEVANRVGSLIDSIRNGGNNDTATAQARHSGLQAQRIAEQVVSAGGNEEKLHTLGESLVGVDPQTTARVVAHVFELDRNAGHWLTAHNVQGRVDSGHIAPREAAAISAGVLGAYLEGDLQFHQMSQATGLQDAAHFYDFGAGQWPTEFRDFVNRAAVDPAFAGVARDFRESFADTVLGGAIPHGLHTEGRPATGGELALALELLDENGPTAIADALGRLDATQRADVFNRTAGTGGVAAANAGIATNGDVFGRITDSIVAAGDSAQDVALELVRFAATREGGYHFFNGRTEVVPERAEQLSDVLLAHSGHVLGTLTDGNQNPSSGRGDGTEFGANLATLANALRITAFSPENPRQAEVLDALNTFAAPHVETANTLPADIDSDALRRDVDDATSRVLGLGAAAQDAFRQANNAAEANVESQRAFVNFVFDVGLAAVPLGGSAKGAVARELTQLFGTAGSSDVLGAAINRGLDKVAGAVVDPATGRLTTEAKDAIVQALGDDQAIVAEVYGNAVDFIDTALVEASNRPREVGERIVNIRSQIDASR